jgi:hypothetical protein
MELGRLQRLLIDQARGAALELRPVPLTECAPVLGIAISPALAEHLADEQTGAASAPGPKLAHR